VRGKKYALNKPSKQTIKTKFLNQAFAYREVWPGSQANKRRIKMDENNDCFLDMEVDEKIKAYFTGKKVEG